MATMDKSALEGKVAAELHQMATTSVSRATSASRRRI